ncbi:SDR family NAD(P)-dependent oxidoreductase [Alloalcanivorax xenomutans]|uniref:SDR family NAD(P)-dependent oxidoreductase n=1 Tax=Alloalcanivorax xenomutans TaxID=1094342 RepID=A0A9Q3VZV8_9GAMM|nr:SDR family NAD(P)-dependent oxidoreductase [Alloalcanivorax xenomutans]ARB47441.1 short-chain dehydrogenase [Alloalcanivorax xenomutans]MCE7508100.1 SDR family NAD(P)-dependent oxidoreductase [Alloalcanivorax xenomutans]
MTDFDGQVVLITGAGRGLGLAYARCIAEQGAKVLIQDSGADTGGHGRDLKVGEHVAAKLRSQGLDVHALPGTIDTRQACIELLHRALAVGGGRLDALIHNAGWVAYEKIEVLEEESFDRMMVVTAKASLWLAQAVWPAMKAAGYGRIVLTTSCRALYPQYVQEGLASYAAAKMAVVGIMNVLASEGRRHGIVVNAVSPVAKTRMWGIEDEPDELLPAEVAPGVAFLASRNCTEGGWVLRAANGQFHATRAMEAAGVDYPRDLRAVRAATTDEVAACWSRIAVGNEEPRS